MGPTWSPDGRTIALADQVCVIRPGQDQETCTGKLLSIDVTTGEQNALTSVEGVPGSPSWSPDGAHLAFSANADDGTPLGLFVIDRAGGNLVRLADGGGPWEGPPDWSPDGTWLEFVRINDDLPDGADKIEVWVVPAGGGEAKLIAEHAAAGW